MFEYFNSVLTYIRDFISLNDLVNLYQQLINQYADAHTDPGNEEKIKAFEETKDKIKNIHSYVNYDSWSAPKIKVFEQISARPLIGEQAIKTLDSALSQFSEAKTKEGLTGLKDQTQGLLTRTQQLITDLGLTQTQKLEEKEDGLAEISFTDISTFQNLWDMSSRAENWQFILGLFARVVKEDIENVKVIAIASSTPPSLIISGGKKLLGFLVKAAGYVAQLKKIKDSFFKERADLEKYGFKKTTLNIAIGEVTVKYGKEYEEKKRAFALSLVKEFRPKEDGENENEIANATGIGLEEMVKQARTGVTVLNPKEVKAVEALPSESLGVAYSEQKKIEVEISKQLEEERKASQLEREQKMRKELSDQISKIFPEDTPKTDTEKTKANGEETTEPKTEVSKKVEPSKPKKQEKKEPKKIKK